MDNVISRTGLELIFLKTFCLRNGIEYRREDDNFTYNIGFGLELYNHFQFDFYRVLSHFNESSRYKHWGLSCSFNRMFRWDKGDDWWWRVSPPDRKEIESRKKLRKH